MEIKSVKFVYFSPTGTTKAIIQGIARGMNPGTMEFVDITKPEARKHPLRLSENELLVVAVPVYMGRVPALLNEWLNAIQAHDTPAVCTVVYGNRAYDNALLELKDIAVSRGCIPIAGAAYIGEHSFSDSGTPVAPGRPDKNDLNHSEVFGQKIGEKLAAVSSISQIPDLFVPGRYPYEGVTKIWDVDFIAVSRRCAQCGVCAEVCPAGAVDSQNSRMIDQEKCVTCCACIKRCPQNARTIKAGPVKDAQKRLMTLYQAPKTPEFFF